MPYHKGKKKKKKKMKKGKKKWKGKHQEVITLWKRKVSLN